MIRQTMVEVTTKEESNNGGGNNKGGDNKNGGNNAQNGNGYGNNISNSGKFGGSAIRRGAFSYSATDRVTSTKVHAMHHVPNPTKHDIMARTKSDSHTDTICTGNNMTLLSYTGYECNVIGFHSELKPMENIPVLTAVIAYNDPL